ncbi:hypothetical protein [Motilibacter aurantiacus]|uniref:hypothetical protein n=1 Tax=Motilibacter aurantiacus TaxID=2714955 RepID=UPI0014083A39|nr:hypothetical protein [Motilibacter aurantiacus]NHC46767.1 hypothetical protein [Motilibacter aurantiacus]
MPLQLGSRTAVLEGVLTVEEAEPLAAWLRETPGARVNLRNCTHLHTAGLQALLAARVKVSVPPVDEFLRAWVAPLLERSATSPDTPKPRDDSAKETP